MTSDKKVERLKLVFSNVNDWLKFAEAKNSLIIGFNAASIFGLVQLLDKAKPSIILLVFLYLIIFILIVSAITAMISFLPKLKIKEKKKNSKPKANPNLVPNYLFYEHLKDRTEIEIINEICGTSVIDTEKFELDIANQIRINSMIASMKLHSFKRAIWLTLLAYSLIPVFLIFYTRLLICSCK